MRYPKRGGPGAPCVWPPVQHAPLALGHLPPRRQAIGGILRRKVTDDILASGTGAVAEHDLALSVGCRFAVHSSQPVTAILQVAPYPSPQCRFAANGGTPAVEHYSYLDGYGNRCERFAFGRGSSQVAFEAQTNVLRPSDLIAPDTPETPVAALPAQVLSS